MRNAGIRVLTVALLSVGLVLVTGVFGAPIEFPESLRLLYSFSAFALLSLLMIALALAGRPGGDSTARTLGWSGALLTLPFALFTFLPGAGPPEFADLKENELRYIILTIDPLLLAVAFGLLCSALTKSGERFWSVIAATLAITAATLDAVFSIISLAEVRLQLRDPSAEIDRLVDHASVLLLFFGSVLFYLATAAAAFALASAKILRKISSILIVSIALLAIIALAFRGLDFPSASEALGNPVLLLGWIAGIPAVPWMLACVLGVIVLYRSARQAG